MAENTQEELDLMSAMLRPALEASYRLNPEQKAQHAICLLCYTLYRRGEFCCEGRDRVEAEKAEEAYQRNDLAKSIFKHLEEEGLPMTPSFARIVEKEVDDMLDRLIGKITTEGVKDV